MTHGHVKFRQNRSFHCGDILIFQILRRPPPPSWIFEIAKGGESRDASACRISSKSINRLQDIKIFRFLKMAAAAILDFLICEILLTDGVWSAQTHHCTKFGQNRSFHCEFFEV